MENDLLDYATAPDPMSRRRLLLIVGSAAVSGIVIGGVTYVLGQPTRTVITMGRMVAPAPVLTTQPSPIPLPGALPPTTQRWQPLAEEQKPGNE